jgi:hypothetical protein
MANAQELGIIGRSYQDGMPIIWKLVDRLPSAEVRARFPWLTVIAWKYEGSGNNGMPSEAVNKQMKTLEQRIGDALQAEGVCEHAYSRTGNNLKELVYYTTDQDKFMDSFNAELKGHPRYPIEILFREDREWSDFATLLGRFKK